MLLNLASVGPATIDTNRRHALLLGSRPFGFDDTTSYLNFIRNPRAPFLSNSTLQVYNYASFTNNGAGVTWIPFDMGGTDYHRVTTMVDPTTGLPRLIFGNDQGVWTVLDNNGTFEIAGRDLRLSCPGVDRNGNLQITQFYYGAAQPSSAAAQIAGALFYGSAQDNGGPVSDPNILSNGNISWSGPGGDATGVGTDQQGMGTAYQYFWPCCGGNDTDFFQYIGPGVSGAGLPVATSAGPSACSRPAAAARLPTRSGRSTGRRQLRRQPGQWQRRRHQLERRPDLLHHEPGRDLVRHRRPGGLRQSRQLQPRPWPTVRPTRTPPRASATWATSSTSARRPADLRHPGRRRQRHEQQLDQHLARPRAAGPSSRSSPTRSAAATTPTPSPPTGVFYIKDSILLANNPANTQYHGSTSPATSTTWPTPSSARPTTRRPTRNSVKLNQAAAALSSIVADWRYTIPNSATDPNGPGFHPVLYVGMGSPAATARACTSRSTTA